MLSSSSVGKKESHCSAKLCTPVWFSIVNKAHLQARKKGKAEKLLKICDKLRKLRKIPENCGPQSPPPPLGVEMGNITPGHIELSSAQCTAKAVHSAQGTPYAVEDC